MVLGLSRSWAKVPVRQTGTPRAGLRPGAAGARPPGRRAPDPHPGFRDAGRSVDATALHDGYGVGGSPDAEPGFGGRATAQRRATWRYFHCPRRVITTSSGGGGTI